MNIEVPLRMCDSELYCSATIRPTFRLVDKQYKHEHGVSMISKRHVHSSLICLHIKMT